MGEYQFMICMQAVIDLFHLSASLKIQCQFQQEASQYRTAYIGIISVKPGRGKLAPELVGILCTDEGITGLK